MSSLGSPARTYSFGGRTFTQGQVQAIRARNVGRRPQGPRVQPLSPLEASGLASATRGYRPTDDPTHTGTDPAVVQKLREQFSGPGVAGYNALKFVLGKSAA